MSILLFAMDGLMSRLILEYLISANIPVKGLVLPSRSPITRKPIRVLQEFSLEWLANEYRLPVYYTSGKDDKNCQKAINTIRPDLILVACFPYRLPESVHEIPPFGSVNIHPSLLPKYRGPVPLFWQFHDGIKESGMTLHFITDRFDSGDIIFQSRTVFSDGIDTQTAIRRLTEDIEISLPGILNCILEQKITPTSQDEQRASYFSWPGPEDFHIDYNWDVRRVFNFIKGTSHWNQLYRYSNGDRSWHLKDAISFEKGGLLKENIPEKTNHHYKLPFRNGVLTVAFLIE